MNKKFLALAIAGAISGPGVALADDSTVTLYGTLNVDFENVKADGCSTAAGGSVGCTNLPSRNRVSQNSSALGFRGIEPLGGGVSAIFQIESGINVDTGLSSTSTGTFATRNSNIGLTGGFGTIFFGNWDTPYKSSTLPLDAVYATGIGEYVGVLSGNSTPTSTNAANRNAFDRRQNNSVQYWTPNLAGFTARFDYSANEQRTATQNPALYGVSLNYLIGPFFVTYAHERHDDYANLITATGTTRTKDDGDKVGLGFTLASTGTSIGLIAERVKYEGNIGATGLNKSFVAGTANEAKVNAYYISALQKFGASTIRLAYGQDQGVKLSGGSGSSVSNTRAKMYVVAYSYSLSKRTDFYAVYAQIRNEANSRNDFAVNAIGLPAPTLATGVLTSNGGNGADPRGIGVGFRHTF